MVLSVVNNKYKMKHSIDLLMYDSLSIFKNCMFDFSILWLWYVVMNNPVTFYKCKVVARMLIGGDAMYRRLLLLLFTSTAQSVSSAQRTNKLLLNMFCSGARASQVSVRCSGRE